MPVPQTNGIHLTRDTLEHHLSAMTVEQGRQAYLAYGNLTDAIQTLRVLARGHGVSEPVLTHAIQTIRRGAAEIVRIPMSRALSRRSSIEAPAV